MQEEVASAIFAQFLQVARAVAKHNALFRARFPTSDPLYRRVEKAMFGTFWDMPVQLHAFWDAVEKKCTWEQHEEFASILDRAVVEIRRDAGKPRPKTLKALNPKPPKP